MNFSVTSGLSLHYKIDFVFVPLLFDEKLILSCEQRWLNLRCYWYCHSLMLTFKIMDTRFLDWACFNRKIDGKWFSALLWRWDKEWNTLWVLRLSYLYLGKSLLKSFFSEQTSLAFRVSLLYVLTQAYPNLRLRVSMLECIKHYVQLNRVLR